MLSLSKNFRVIHIQGEKAGDFLQSQLTNDVREANTQQLQWQAYCNRQGLVQSIFGLWGEGRDYFLLIAEDLVATTQALLQKYGVFSKIYCEVFSPEVTLELLPSSEKNLTWQLKHFSPEKIELVWAVPAVIARSVSDEAIQVLRANLIHHGFPWLCQATSNLFRPHDLNLPELGMVSFKKGCFPGQEIIARMQYRGKPKQGLYVFELENERTLVPAQALMLGEKNIGQVVDAVVQEGRTYVSAVLAHEYANLPPSLFFS